MSLLAELKRRNVVKVGVGVSAYWRTKGFPPQCRPLGDKDFTCD